MEPEPEYTAKNWRDGASCAQIGGDLWFPEKGARHDARQAKRICESCPVRELCFEYALTLPTVHHGIWGGKVPREIREERARRMLPGYELDPEEEPEDESVYE